MSRIVKQDRNVIQADFRPTKLTLNITFHATLLYRDDLVALARVTYLVNGQSSDALPPHHVVIDLHPSKETA